MFTSKKFNDEVRTFITKHGVIPTTVHLSSQQQIDLRKEIWEVTGSDRNITAINGIEVRLLPHVMDRVTVGTYNIPTEGPHFSVVV